MLLGHLAELVVDDQQGSITATPAAMRGLFVAWMPGKDELAIVRRTHGRAGPLSHQVIKIHTLFHDVAPRAATTWDWPTRGPWKRVGLVRVLTYIVPDFVKSPGKAGAKWVHHFGDHGEEGHGPMRGEKQYPDRFKPLLIENPKGEMRIQRRPGNKYDVTKWIYW